MKVRSAEFVHQVRLADGKYVQSVPPPPYATSHEMGGIRIEDGRGGVTLVPDSNIKFMHVESEPEAPGYQAGPGRGHKKA